MSNKTFTQQRAILRPNKNAAFFADDDDDEDDDDDLYSLTDDGSSSVTSLSTNADTLVLAQFLASTGPEEFLKPSKKQQQNPQFRRASRLFNRLRKKGAQQGINTTTMLSNVSTATKGNLNGSVNSHRSGQTKTTHMPLPVYQPTPEIPLTAPNSAQVSNAAIHATPHPAHPSSNKNMAFLSHQPKPRQRHTNHHQEQTITPTKSTSSSSVTSHNAPNPSTSRSSSSNASRRQLSLRDSGVYSDFSEKEDMIPPVPAPSLPVKSQFRSSPHHAQPKRPAPLPASVASAAIASATAGTKDALPSQPPPIPAFNQRRALSSTSSASAADRRSVIRHSGAVPAAALKRRSVRIRHIQVQTDQPTSQAEEKGEHVCSHCHQPLANGNGGRRTSCPSILPNGQLIPKQQPVEGSQELLEMIEHLKAQLAQEQHSRLQLEQAMSRQQETAKKIDLVQREKDRWKGDCLWLNDRIALLPE